MNRRWMIVFALLLIVGCGPAPLHFCETTLHSDGRVDRAVIQHVSSTPDEMRDAAIWEKSGYLEQRPEEFDVNIRDSKLQEAPHMDQGQRYFAAWKRFDSLNSIPDHLKLESETRSASLKRTYQRRDYGLFIEHMWIEELPNVITLHDSQMAQRELAKLMCDRTEFILEKGLGDEFDVSKFVAWCRTEGTTWFEHACAAHWENAVSRSKSLIDHGSPQKFSWLQAVCREHGLDLSLDNSRPNYDQTTPNRAAINRFVTELVGRTIQRNDGQAIPEKELTRLGSAIRMTLTGDVSERLLKKDATLRKLKTADEEFVKSFPEGSEGLEKRMMDLVERIWGMDGIFAVLLGFGRRFTFTTSLPGRLIESNGELVSESTTRWRFDAEAMFPIGVTMRARSIERIEFPVAGLNPALKNDPSKLNRLIDLVGSDEPLMKTLQSCREAKSLEPLDRYIKTDATVDGSHDSQLRAGSVKEWLTHRGKFSPTPAEK